MASSTTPFQTLLRSTLKVLIMVSLGFNALTAFADPPPAPHHYWRNSNYPNHYVLYDAKLRQWVETIDCRVAYKFRAIKNELNNLYLYDDSRGMTVLVNYDGMFLKAAGASEFSSYQRGTFDTRERFYHFDNAGGHTGTFARAHGCQWQEWFPGNANPAYTFVQTRVGGDGVEMHDGSRNISVKLEPGRMLLKQGNQPYSFYRNGHF